MTVTDTGSGLWAKAPDRLRSVDVATLPYPGVATDYKPLVTAMLAVADGVGIVTENLFAGRFRYVEELVRMGADIRTDSHHAVVRGVPRLSGAPVRAHDIRAGASLVVAGLAADGETVISAAHHIDRGYENIVGQAGVGRRRHRAASDCSVRRRLDSVGVGVVGSIVGWPRAARFGPAAAAARSPGSGRAPSASRPTRPGGRRPSLAHVEHHVHLVGVVALDLEVAGLVRRELELRLHAGRHLLLEVVAVDVVGLVGVGHEAQHDVVAQLHVLDARADGGGVVHPDVHDDLVGRAGDLARCPARRCRRCRPGGAELAGADVTT